MKEKDIVKFKNPTDEDEENALMVIVEMRDNRVLVRDLRFLNWIVSPSDVYAVSDLEFIDILPENK